MSPQRAIRDRSLLIGKNLVNGNWIESQSGQRFNVYGMPHEHNDTVHLPSEQTINAVIYFRSGHG